MSSELSARRVVVEVVAVDVDVDAPDRVDGLREALEVDVDDVVDLEAGQVLDRLQRLLDAAVGVGLVELGGRRSWRRRCRP